MNFFGIKLRLTLLGLAVALMGTMIALVTVNSQRHGEELRLKLSQVDAESLGMAEHFKDSIRDVNDKLTRYRATHNPAAWKDFIKASQDLNTWMQSQVPTARTAREQAILKQLDDAYLEYVKYTSQFQQTPDPVNVAPVVGEQPDPFAQMRRHLFDLGQDLSQAHLDQKKELLAQAHATLTELQQTVLAALGLLFVSVVALAILVYRDMIAPLRRRLVENQARMEQQEKLASLGLLAAGVAHEIRNPLTAIRAALFTQQRKFRPDSAEHADVKVVEREILRLERIVNDFLQFARPGEPIREVMPVEMLLQEARQFFMPQLSRTNIQIYLEPAPAVALVNVDPQQIKQVLINLVQNAADSIGQNGEITLRFRMERRPLAGKVQDAVLIEVADTGKGISPETQKRLFDPFFTTKNNGTGLGLSIALRIVEKHGGVIEYQTQTKRGSTFAILLPAVTP